MTPSERANLIIDHYRENAPLYSDSESQRAAVVDYLISVIESVEQEATAAAVEQCAESIQSWLIADCRFNAILAQKIADHIRSLSPLPPGEYERRIRLKEAEWWEHLAQGHHDDERCTTCIYCERLASLQPQREAKGEGK